MTNAGNETGGFDVAARIRAARARERALADVPVAVRSPAALRDRLLATLAAVDGVRRTGDRALTAISVRYPRVGGTLRDAAGRTLAVSDAASRRTRGLEGPPER